MIHSFSHFMLMLMTCGLLWCIGFVSLIISMLTIGRRFDKQFKDAHIPWHFNVAFYGHFQRCGSYIGEILSRSNLRSKKGPAYKYYGDFDFRAHCSSFELYNAYICGFTLLIGALCGIINYIIDYFT